MGPLCTTGQIANIEREVAHALEEGAKLLCGGSRPEGTAGLHCEPTIIKCPRQDLRIVDTELFEPVLTVQRFQDEAEAIHLANDTVHGLATDVFTSDSDRSLHMVDAIRAGIVWVHTNRVVSSIAEAGGVKHSGYGREPGFQAIYGYTRPKTVRMNTSSEPLGSQFVFR